MVLPSLSWAEIESIATKQRGYFEILDVAISSRSTYDRHDLNVDPFGHRIVDRVRTVDHNVIDSLLQTLY
jgi:hypothetical protein